MSQDLKTKFEKKTDEVKSLPDQPNEILLKLYALFKQASLGDVQGKKPGLLDLRGRAKYQAWEDLKGTSSEQAMQEYVNLVESLQADCE